MEYLLFFIGSDSLTKRKQEALPVAEPISRRIERRCKAMKEELTAEKLVKNVKPEIKNQALTLANAVLAMQEKIEQQIPEYQQMPIVQVLTTTQGEKALKQNPAMQEFRATVRDYAAALNNLQEIISENKAPTNVSDMAELRKKFKMAK